MSITPLPKAGAAVDPGQPKIELRPRDSGDWVEYSVYRRDGSSFCPASGCAAQDFAVTYSTIIDELKKAGEL